MDYFWFRQLNQVAGQWLWLDAAAVFVAKYFEFFLIFILLAFLFGKFSKYWKMVLQALAAAVLSRFVFVNIIHFLLPRPRPFVDNAVNLLVERTNDPSFPSGHAAFYFAIATVVFYYSKDAGALFFFLGAILCLARVFVGIHWPSDILAGLLVAMFSGWLVMKISKKR